MAPAARRAVVRPLAGPAACRARVVLARGEADPMVTADQLAELQPEAVTLPRLGHNAHVEDPAAVLRLLERLGGQLL